MSKKQQCFLDVKEIPLSWAQANDLKLSHSEIVHFLNAVFGQTFSYFSIQDMDMSKPYAILVQSACIKNGISSLTSPSKWDMGKTGASTVVQRRKFRKISKQVFQVGKTLLNSIPSGFKLNPSMTRLGLDDDDPKNKKAFSLRKKQIVQRFFLFNALLKCNQMNVERQFMPVELIPAWNRILQEKPFKGIQ